MENPKYIERMMKQITKQILYSQNLINITCCFTGHRSQKLPWGFDESDSRCVAMKEWLRAEIVRAIDRGYIYFISGMALGFDIICAEMILALKEKYPQIKLIGAIPCMDQGELWSDTQKARYKKALLQCDGVKCLYDTYKAGCMIERNDYMLDNSSLVIALYDGRGGGTGYTVKKALTLGKEVRVGKP